MSETNVLWCRGCGVSVMNHVEKCPPTEEEGVPEYNAMFEGKSVSVCPTCGYTELSYAAFEAALVKKDAEIVRLRMAINTVLPHLTAATEMDVPIRIESDRAFGGVIEDRARVINLPGQLAEILRDALEGKPAGQFAEALRAVLEDDKEEAEHETE